MVDTSDSAHKRSLEYLFMGDHPALPGELDRAVEHGFRAASALAAMVGHLGVGECVERDACGGNNTIRRECIHPPDSATFGTALLQILPLQASVGLSC